MAKGKGIENVGIVISDKNGVADIGSMRAVDKIIEHRIVQIYISKRTIKELAKGIMDGDVEELSEQVIINLEYSSDKEDEKKSLPKGKVIAY